MPKFLLYTVNKFLNLENVFLFTVFEPQCQKNGHFGSVYLLMLKNINLISVVCQTKPLHGIQILITDDNGEIYIMVRCC